MAFFFGRDERTVKRWEKRSAPSKPRLSEAILPGSTWPIPAFYWARKRMPSTFCRRRIPHATQGFSPSVEIALKPTSKAISALSN